MSISSVSSGSSLWEAYKKQRAQAQSNDTAAAKLSVDPGELIKELEKLKEDPEQLKAKAAELQAQVEEALEQSSDEREAEMLGRISTDLAAVAEGGDLSVMTSKMPPRPGGMDNNAPNGSEMMSPGGLGGSQGASMKWLEALLEEEDEDEEDEDIILNSPEDLLEQLSALKDKNSSKFVSTVTELAEEVRSKAESATGEEAERLNLLAEDLEDAAATGSLASMEGRLAEGIEKNALFDNRNVSGYDSSKALSMMYLQAQVSLSTQRLSA